MVDGVISEFLGWFATIFTKILCLLFLKFTLHFTMDIQDKSYSWTGFQHFTTQYSHHTLVFLPFPSNRMQLLKTPTNILCCTVQVKSTSTSTWKSFGNGSSSPFGMESAVSLVRWFLLKDLFTRMDCCRIIGSIQQVHSQSSLTLSCWSCSLSLCFGTGSHF